MISAVLALVSLSLEASTSSSFQRTVLIDHHSRSIVGLSRPTAAAGRLPAEGMVRVMVPRALVVGTLIVMVRLSDSKVDGMC